MPTVVYPGSFDPVSNGHEDIIARISMQFTKVYVLVAYNPIKQQTTFSVEERVQMLQKVCAKYKNVEVVSTTGFVVDFAATVGASLIIKGVRNSADFLMEMSQYQFNRQINPKIDTAVFLAAKDHIFIASSAIRELASLGGDISPYVPKEVVNQIRGKYAK